MTAAHHVAVPLIDQDPARRWWLSRPGAPGRSLLVWLALAAGFQGCATTAASSSAPSPLELVRAGKCITEQEVVDAQLAWGEGIIEIGRVKTEGGDAVAAAKKHITTFYGYDLSLVLFKPTLAAVAAFRTSFDAALSYFVGGNESFPEDKGFALKPWSKVRWQNAGIVNNSCNMAVAMGDYWFTPATGGSETKVEYTFAYVRGPAGELKIVVHHSSLPYSPR